FPIFTSVITSPVVLPWLTKAALFPINSLERMVDGATSRFRESGISMESVSQPVAFRARNPGIAPFAPKEQVRPLPAGMCHDGENGCNRLSRPVTSPLEDKSPLGLPLGKSKKRKCPMVIG